MNNIKFRIAAKTDVGLVRTNNEDNFQASSDLTHGSMSWTNNQICSLGDKGALLVVADGMGGMNAGEVASAIAIETVREYFAPERLTDEVTKSRFSIEKYMNEVIVIADQRIKQEAAEHPESRGMGTTIVIGWIIDGKLYVSWCGDSRAYVYNPKAGLHQISKDHSYVQSLVDKGTISREDAFDFPDSNIITRCLCDSNTKAKPESLLRPYDLCDNDIVMLCTDGLSGMLRDNEIEEIIRAYEHNMDELASVLIQAACEAEGSDNITLCLCQILQGGAVCNPAVFIETEKRLNGKGGNTQLTNTVNVNNGGGGGGKKKFPTLLIIILLVVLLAVAGVLCWLLIFNKEKEIEAENDGQTVVETEVVEKTTTATENVSQPVTETATDPARQSAKNGENIGKPLVIPAQEPEVLPGDEELTPIGGENGNQPDPNSEVSPDNELTPVGSLGKEPAKTKPAPKVETDFYIIQAGDYLDKMVGGDKVMKKAIMTLNDGRSEFKVGEKIVVPKGFKPKNH